MEFGLGFSPRSAMIFTSNHVGDAKFFARWRPLNFQNSTPLGCEISDLLTLIGMQIYTFYSVRVNAMEITDQCCQLFITINHTPYYWFQCSPLIAIVCFRQSIVRFTKRLVTLLEKIKVPYFLTGRNIFARFCRFKVQNFFFTIVPDAFSWTYHHLIKAKLNS